jgi:hypothetical protein
MEEVSPLQKTGEGLCHKTGTEQGKRQPQDREQKISSE